MKYLILVLSLVNSLLSVQAQVGTDPNLNIALDGNARQGVVDDTPNQNSLRALNIAAESACPNCAASGHVPSTENDLTTRQQSSTETQEDENGVQGP